MTELQAKKRRVGSFQNNELLVNTMVISGNSTHFITSTSLFIDISRKRKALDRLVDATTMAIDAKDDKFAHLLQPIRDLAANWSINIANELGDYLVGHFMQ